MSEIVAAVDVGTNSFHLVVARFDDEGRFEVLTAEREMVRLGSGAGDMKRLQPDAVDRGVAALARMRTLAVAHGADHVRGVATSAVREAANRDEFLHRARDEAGVDIDVVSGFEEARLIHLGVLQALPVFDRRLLLCDIGGGSTELLIGQGGDVLGSRSLRLGAIRLTQRFFTTDPASPQSVAECRRFVRTVLAPAVASLAPLGHEVAVGTSGTIGAVLRVALGGGPPGSMNAAVVGSTALRRGLDQVIGAGRAADRARLPGVDESRADIILAGALILEGVLDAFEPESLTFSEYALREGALLDAWRRAHGGSLHHLRELRRRGVEQLLSQLDEDPDHARAVARLALELFDALAATHGLGDLERELLEAAALLANVGLFVSHARHHHHSYYLIRNSEHLVGFTDHEIEVVALVARYHRKSAPRGAHRDFKALDPADRQVVRSLAAILRVAVGLDRGHAGKVESLVVDVEADACTIGAVARGGTDLDLEINAAQERSGLLSDVLGRPVSVVKA